MTSETLSHESSHHRLPRLRDGASDEERAQFVKDVYAIPLEVFKRLVFLGEINRVAAGD